MIFAQIELGFPIGYFDGDCKWHTERNIRYNLPASGTLTFVGYRWDPLPYRYYIDEVACVWRLESIVESYFHGPGNFKFTRPDRNGYGSHETVIDPEPNESRLSAVISNNNQIVSGDKQQTYNYFDHHKDIWSIGRHEKYDINPHTGDCGDEYSPVPSQKHGQPYDWDEKMGPSATWFPAGSIEIPTVGSYDPNDIIGPAGFGEQQWVSNGKALPYRINFENDPDSASAAAQRIEIQFEMDEILDASSFRFGSFGFSSFESTSTTGRTGYKKRIDVIDIAGVHVDVDFHIEMGSRLVTWTFQTIDPGTGIPPTDPFAGFLPVNDSISHSGEGFVDFYIKPKSTAYTGDIVAASANIVFDFNNPIATNTWMNTIDASPPESWVNTSITPLDSTAYQVSWTGADTGNGSSLKDYNIYYSDTSGVIKKWIGNTTDVSAIFYGKYGNSYQFYSTSRDNVHNIEARPDTYDALLQLDNNTGIEDLITSHDTELTIFPNPSKCCFRVVSNFEYNAIKTIQVFSVTGKMVLEKQFTTNEIAIDLSNKVKGTYFIKVTCENYQADDKIVIY